MQITNSRYGGWLIYAFLLGTTLLPWQGYAQTLDSRLGSAHTPRGHLHLLVVFVRYDTALAPNWTSWPDNATLPTFAQDDSPSTPGMNQLFTADTTTLKNNLGYRNISQFYYEASGETFLLTADIYPQQVPINYISSGLQRFQIIGLPEVARYPLLLTRFSLNRKTRHTAYPRQSEGSLMTIHVCGSCYRLF